MHTHNHLITGDAAHGVDQIAGLLIIRGVAIFEILERRVINEKQRVAIGLRAGLQSVGGLFLVVLADCLATLAESTLAVSCAQHKTTLEDIRKHEDALRHLGKLLGLGSCWRRVF